MPGYKIPGKIPLPGLQKATFLPFPHMMEREKALISLLFIRTLVPSLGPQCSLSHQYLITSQSPNLHIVFGAITDEFGETQTFSP